MKAEVTNSRNRIIRIIAIATMASFVLITLTFMSLIIYYPNIFFNSFLKGKIEARYIENNPGSKLIINSLHYKFWDDEIKTDTISVYKNDSILLYKIIGGSMNGIKFKHLLNGGPKGDELLGCSASAKDVYVSLTESSYDIHCKALKFSICDSTIEMEAFEYKPLLNDKEFFGSQIHQQTRYIAKAPYIKLSGVDFAGIIHGKSFHAHALKLNKLEVDILIDRYKTLQGDTSHILMPNESYRLMKNPFSIDSLIITEGKVCYSELFDLGGKKATITLDQVNLFANEIIDPIKKSVTCIINTKFLVNNVAPMKVFLNIPLTSETFSMKYSGTCGKMDMTVANPYLDVAECMRFKSGMVNSAAFDLDITAGYASGNLSVAYSNLKVEPSNQKTKQSSRKRKINSFLANAFAIKSNNLPDKKGMLKQGKIKFIRAHDTAFIDMLWLSLRTGLSDISGIKEL